MITTTAPITLADVMTELRTVTPGRAFPISLGDADVRALAGVASGPISLTNLLGKSAYVAMSGSVPNRSDTAAINGSANYTKSVAVSVSVAGGLAPFSYAWSQVSGSGAVVPANAGTINATFPVNRFDTPGDVLSQLVQCVVTDSTGATLARTGTVTLTLT